ncbi:ABC transporter permease subunit [Roseovarius amoyensis]|uniref:branched-chain amino acid ABC transporter ATP-binding protein/permease n=1 Tax=Roseovarius amoyensis TaxID=2211448 RepID=UPI000DBE3B4B|nr:ATP-binding cassette domain-containing protein [Roseovarius amoyensis]
MMAARLTSRTATDASPRGRRGVRTGHAVFGTVLAIAALAAPQIFTSGYALDVLVTMVLNAVMALGLAIVVRSGRMSLAQATFGGIGGYASGILMMQLGWSWWPAWFASGVAGAAFGLLLGLTSLRLRGFYFAIATFTFSLIAIQILSAWRDVTGGLSGMFGLPIPPDLFGYDWLDPRVYYYFGLAVAVGALIVCWLCTEGSRFGRRLRALGADEIVAGSIGVPAAPYRILAFAIASGVAGLAGSLNAHFIGGISPADIVPSASVFILVMVLAGGAQSLWGPVIGAIVLTGIPEVLRASAQWSMVLYGVFLLSYVYLFRDGLVPLFQRLAGSLTGGGATAAVAARADAPAPGTVRPHAHYRVEGASLALENITCGFGDYIVLDGVSFAAQKGEIFGVIGPNGAGKTTLFNTLTGIAPMRGGRLLLNGAAVRPSPSGMAQLGVGRTFQHPFVLGNHTVAQSIRVAAEARGSIQDQDYLDWVISVCDLATLLDLPTDRLTHYQRRLLTIAMAIAPRPALLLLDEPLAGMDETETAELKEKIAAIHDALACTILLIEHKIGVVMELCDNLAVLDFGKIIATGEPHAIARDPVVIEAYLGA